jgi:erythromycin esterase-like protein
VARIRYGCLSPWESSPEIYGRAALTGQHRVCEQEAVAMLTDLMSRRVAYAKNDGAHFLNAIGNARLIADAERYYRAMYYGGSASWNLRDRHMMATLEALLAHDVSEGGAGKAVVWAHNSHLGDASATEMGARDEINLGQLCRERFGEAAYLVGFGTDHGTVMAASQWDGPGRIMRVIPGRAGSYERAFHESGRGTCTVPMRRGAQRDLVDALRAPLLQRAIGVIYRPETELQSHYFHASLPLQFDEYVWLDETHAVTPLTRAEGAALGHGHPFGTAATV